MTPASSDSVELASTVPALMNTKPPGTANALMAGSWMTKYWKPRPPSALCEASRRPTPFTYSLTSGSSSSAFWSRSWCATMAPRRYSSLRDSTAAAGLPMSGRSEPGAGVLRVSGVDGGSSANATPARLRRAAARAGSRRRMIAFDRRWRSGVSPGLQRLTKTLCGTHSSVHLEDVRGEIGEPRALPAHQGDMPGMRPAAEAIHGIGETGGHLRKVGRIDLGDVAEAGELGAGAGAGDQRLHLLRREVLGLVQDQEAVEEGAPAHEVERADLDAVAQQVVGGRAAPVASLLRPGEHLEIVHERTHPGLHLLLLRAGQEADVFAERNGHARHDDFHEAVGFQRLHEAGGERQQRLAGAGWPQHRDEVDFRIHQQVEREVLLAVRAVTPQTLWRSLRWSRVSWMVAVSPLILRTRPSMPSGMSSNTPWFGRQSRTAGPVIS